MLKEMTYLCEHYLFVIYKAELGDVEASLVLDPPL